MAKITRGQSILGTNVNDWNNLVESSNTVRSSIVQTAPPAEAITPGATRILAYNPSNHYFEMGEAFPLSLSDIPDVEIDYEVGPDTKDLIVQGLQVVNSGSSSEPRAYGVCAEPIAAEGYGWIYTAGTVWARVIFPASMATQIYRASVSSQDTRGLKLDPAGAHTVQWFDSKNVEGGGASDNAETVRWCIVNLGVPTTLAYLATMSGDVNYGSSGSVQIMKGPGDVATDVVVDAEFKWLGKSGDTIKSGTEVVVTYFPWDKKWHITEAACPPEEPTP